MSDHGFPRLLALLCTGCIFMPAAASAGAFERQHQIYAAQGYAPFYREYTPGPYYHPTARNKQNLNIYLNAPGNTVRFLDGGNQIVIYDRECRIHNELVPSARGPHPVTVTRC
jgi:hypothetical protein